MLVDGGGVTAGKFSRLVLNIAPGGVDLSFRSSAGRRHKSFSVWRAACFRAADHSKEEDCRRVVLVADEQFGTLIR